MDEVDGNCFGKSNKTESSLENKDDNTTLPPFPTNNNNVQEAVMPIDQRAIYYKMSHQSRGLLLIFNHEKFDPSTEQAERSGTDEDVLKITECFKVLGFEIRPYKDLTLGEIRHYIWNCINENHDDRDCLAIFVLSHGDKDVLFAKDTWYNPAKELWGRFTSDKCPSLAGKPKLIFLQACQGKEFDLGMQLVARPSRTEFDGVLRSYKLPVAADFLIVYATFEGDLTIVSILIGFLATIVLARSFLAAGLAPTNKRRVTLLIATMVQGLPTRTEQGLIFEPPCI